MVTKTMRWNEHMDRQLKIKALIAESDTAYDDAYKSSISGSQDHMGKMAQYRFLNRELKTTRFVGNLSFMHVEQIMKDLIK